ncbi:hypothetical protein L208DRAFT_1559624 [Tricholoma matsutake]|nr:hypothetical protein L208DRAFT_1559624 [Tricholoma matsutake 945]
MAAESLIWAQVSFFLASGWTPYPQFRIPVLPPPWPDQLWRILISKSAHLIWKLCCERVIRNKNNPIVYTR